MRDEFDGFTVDLVGTTGGGAAVGSLILLENGNGIALENGTGALILEV